MNRQIDVDELVTELNPELLPEVVEDMVVVIGMDKTMLLIKSYGGGDMRVPVGVEDSVRRDELVAVIGEESACEFMEVYGGDRLYIPKCEMAYREKRNISFINAINGAVRSGMSKTKAIQSLAVDFGITERWAYEVLKSHACYLDGCLDKQMDIFG